MNAVTLSIPIVDSHFRPPAPQVLTILPIGTPLELVHESDDHYDPNAIAVFTDLSNWPTSKMSLLQGILPPELDAEFLCHRGPFHLGYIARSGQKAARGGPGNAEACDMASRSGKSFAGLTAVLGRATDGWPVAIIQPKASL
jgi:hypothetical protein